jgi:hypothetical protein
LISSDIPAIEASQPGFDVGEGDGHFRRGHCAGQGGVGVAVNQEPVRTFFEQQVLDALEHRAGLIGMRTRTHSQAHVGRGHLESLEKGTGHFVVVVLPGVHEDLRVPLSQLPG